MPRSERARVQTLLNGPFRIRENRTSAHVTLVLETATGGPRARGRPKDTITLMTDGELSRAGRMYEAITQTELNRPAAWCGEPFLVGKNQWIDVTGQGRKKLSTFVRGKAPRPET